MANHQSIVSIANSNLAANLLNNAQEVAAYRRSNELAKTSRLTITDTDDDWTNGG